MARGIRVVLQMARHPLAAEFADFLGRPFMGGQDVGGRNDDLFHGSGTGRPERIPAQRNFPAYTGMSSCDSSSARRRAA